MEQVLTSTAVREPHTDVAAKIRDSERLSFIWSDRATVSAEHGASETKLLSTRRTLQSLRKLRIDSTPHSLHELPISVEPRSLPEEVYSSIEAAPGTFQITIPPFDQQSENLSDKELPPLPTIRLSIDHASSSVNVDNDTALSLLLREMNDIRAQMADLRIRQVPLGYGLPSPLTVDAVSTAPPTYFEEE
ncbi:hypothetical protein EW145_g2799 [Phellinidium pouzarii]|uniref:Uncharacterized protein n=1 Tax=Phellinidium pouzarii TaxID=167371 RepID=A0A4S4LA03_9AGAM|nr:hypothetical protein EW145_g2799 [Phellinidium pouzarii]